MGAWRTNGSTGRRPRRRAPARLLALGFALALTVALAVALSAALVACRGRPGLDAERSSPGAPADAPRSAREAPAAPATPESAAAEPPAGMYFLHEPGFGLERCAFVGERTTGTPGRDGVEERARARAVLDLAEQARWLGGNVVELPNFREDYQAGRLQGRVYRCDERERSAIYRRAVRERRLTVVAP